MTEPVRPRVLLVDDEPKVLEGLTLHLRRRFEVHTASNGAMALAWMHTQQAPAVVVSDMHMPGMDGATFLASVRRLYPTTVRVLLTGQANINSAIAAINEGQVYRFLTKPCPPATLQLMVDAAVEQHVLLTSERVLLQQTLHGSVEALLEVLSLANPVSFGWAQRVKRLVGELSARVGYEESWLVEIAAMFSQLGYVTLPSDVAEKVYFGRTLSDDETAMVARVPEVTDRLLAHIPRLHDVREILSRASRATDAPHAYRDAASTTVRIGAQILGVAMGYLQLEALGDPPAEVVAILRGRTHGYDAPILDALTALRCGDVTSASIHEVSLAALQTGMVLAADIQLAHGPLLAARGYVVTDSFVDRCRNLRDGSVVEPIRVLLA